MEDSPQLRLAQAADAPTIAALINAAFRQVEGAFVAGDRISIEEVRSCLGSGTFLLAEKEGSIIGCVYVERRIRQQNAYAYLGLLAVAPECQQYGVGSQLMLEAEDYCRKLGCRSMEIKIVNLRDDLPEFYRKRGYRETGTSPFPNEVKTLMPCHFIDMAKPLEQRGDLSPLCSSPNSKARTHRDSD